MRKLVSFFALALLLAPAPAAHGANLASIGDGYLLEAEAFDAKIPDDADFARPKKDAVASGGQTLLGFYVRERALRYDVVLPESGQYSIWLRYASNGEVRFSFSLNGAKDALRAVLPATGSLEGWEAYRWTRIYEGPLQAGALSLLAQSATMRPDCFLFSLSKEPPTHMSTPEHAARPMDEATLALLAKPIEPIRPDWIEGAKNYELPEWFDQWRVCAHTRLGPPWRDKPIFLDAAAPLASLGFHVFSRHIKTGKEGAWWPSRVGPVEDWARDRDWAREILDDAHRNGLRLIVYYRHMEDAGMAERHPDWVCVDAAGAPVETNRGAIMCLNSPYVDYLLERQLELAERGADGFYYDEVHMPKQGCWCSFCRRLFEERTGLEMPSAADPRDPVWQKLIEFKNATIERAFLKLRQGLHAANPEIVMLISGNSYPAMVENHTSHRLYRIADSFKTEFSLPDRIGNNRVFQVDSSLKRPESDVRIAMGYALARDAADGRPAHIWCHGLINEESAVYAAAGMIAHGCIANLDNSEGEIPNPALFQKAVALGNRVSPALAGTRPLYWALVHFSEEARNRRLPDDRADA